MIGYCQNKECQAFDQEVIIPKKYGSFNIAKECVLSNCPMCSHKAKNIHNCGFDSSVFVFNGYTNESGEKKVCGKTTHDKFLTFSSASNGSSIEQYQFLEA